MKDGDVDTASPEVAALAQPAATEHEQFRVMAETSPVLIWATDASGRVAFVNRAYCAFFGVTAEQVQSSGWQPLVHPDDVAGYVGKFFEALAARRPYRAQARVRRVDGEWRWIDSHGSPWFDSDGTLLGCVGSSPDITELVEARAAAEAANRLRDEAIAMISHELRTPMTTIVGWTQMLAGGGLDDETTAVGFQQLQSCSEMLKKLVDDLLDLGRIAGSRMTIESAPLNLVDAVRGCVSAAARSAEQKGVRLHSDLATSPIIVVGDNQRLQQVVNNLLSNAIKFTPAAGAVEVSVRRVGTSACVAVSDTGHGIPEEFLPHVFERFTQQEPGNGLGLGLAISKEIVELHGGKIIAESGGAAAGATFTVTIPVQHAQ